MEVNLRSLIGKLTPATRAATEAAAGLCPARTHYNVEIEHYSLSDLFDGGERNLITINMSEFQEAHRVSTIKGSTGCVGGGEGGARNVDNILKNTILSEISKLILGDIAQGLRLRQFRWPSILTVLLSTHDMTPGSEIRANQ